MNPSAKEYLYTLENIKEELLCFKSEQNQLKLQISNLFEENKRLTNELKENVELRLLHLTESELGQLEQKLQSAVASKNAAIEMWQVALQQLENQEELIIGKKSIVATERDEREKQYLQIKNEYMKGLNVLSEELSNSRSEISNLQKELDIKNSKLEICKTDLSSAHKEINLSNKKISALSDDNSKFRKEIRSLQNSLTDTDKFLDTCKENVSALTAKNAELSANVFELEEINKKLKADILICEKDAKDSLSAAEQAVLQKKEIICKEEQYRNEIKLLKSSIDVEKEKVCLQYKTEMKNMKNKYAEKIKDLMSEIDELHKQIGEKDTLFDRANRDKQALESKFELLYFESSNGMPVSNSVFDDMCKRLTIAERAKDELELKVSSLETALQEVKASNEHEIQYLMEKQNTLNERLIRLSKDFNQVSSDRIKLSDEVTKLKKNSSDLEKELLQERSKYISDISKARAELHHKQKMLQEKLHFTKEHYTDACSELQTLLDAALKMNNKWKAEVEHLISQSETTVKELCQENMELKNRTYELVNLLHQNNLPVPSEILISLS